MDQNFILYGLVILLVVIGVTILKKVTSCLVKSVLLFVVLAVVAFLYYAFFR